MVESLDEKYLGERLPGNESQREQLLKWLEELIEEDGAESVIQNRKELLNQAHQLIDMGMSGT